MEHELQVTAGPVARTISEIFWNSACALALARSVDVPCRDLLPFPLSLSIPTTLCLSVHFALRTGAISLRHSTAASGEPLVGTQRYSIALGVALPETSVRTLPANTAGLHTADGSRAHALDPHLLCPQTEGNPRELLTPHGSSLGEKVMTPSRGDFFAQQHILQSTRPTPSSTPRPPRSYKP